MCGSDFRLKVFKLNVGKNLLFNFPHFGIHQDRDPNSVNELYTLITQNFCLYVTLYMNVYGILAAL